MSTAPVVARGTAGPAAGRPVVAPRPAAAAAATGAARLRPAGIAWHRGRATADAAADGRRGPRRLVGVAAPRGDRRSRDRGQRRPRPMRALRDWHVTVVQLYDWMYRHYRYRAAGAARTPSSTPWVGGCRHDGGARRDPGGPRGRRSRASPTARSTAPSGSTSTRHPDERVFDERRRARSAWARRSSSTTCGRDGRGAPAAARVRRGRPAFGFDGIHMDTYGPPHAAVGADGEPIDFAAEYPGLIAEAAARRGDAPGRVRASCSTASRASRSRPWRRRRRRRSTWSCGRRTTVSRTSCAGSTGRAAVAAGRAVVIAAYLSVPAHRGATDPIARPGAIEAAVLLTSVIAAAGAYHHVLAAGDRLLVEGYYPEARRLRADERERCVLPGRSRPATSPARRWRPWPGNRRRDSPCSTSTAARSRSRRRRMPGTSGSGLRRRRRAVRGPAGGPARPGRTADGTRVGAGPRCGAAGGCARPDLPAAGDGRCPRGPTAARRSASRTAGCPRSGRWVVLATDRRPGGPAPG